MKASATLPYPALLLDTNVWLNNAFSHRCGHAAASELVMFAAKKDVPLLYAPHSLKDVFYLAELEIKRAQRQLGNPTEQERAAARELAWGIIGNIQELACAVGCDESDVWLSSKLKSVHGDFEDNLLLVAAARAQGCYLVTEDERLRAHAHVPCANAATMLRLLENNLA